MTLTERLAKVRLLVCDFDGVFTDNHVYTFADGSEAVRTSRADGIGIERLKKLGVHVEVLTSEPPGIVDVRCQKLGVSVSHTGSAHNKLLILDALINLRSDFSYETTAYIGNDVNDLRCLRAVGFAFIPRQSELSQQMFRIPGAVECAPGGEGAVREICDLIAHGIEASHSMDSGELGPKSYIQDYSA